MIENPTPKAITIWLTGLSGSGKTTLANALGEKLKEKNINYLCIDGDVLRDGLCNDLGFTDADRKENMRRASCLAKMMNDQGQRYMPASNYVVTLEDWRGMKIDEIIKPVD